MRSGRIIAASNFGSPRAAAFAIAVLFGMNGILATPASAAPGTLTVNLDKAKLIKYPAETETIIVGNPIIADVTMLKNAGVLILTGKGYGETNLVFLNRAGAILSESNLRVEPSNSLMIVQRGADRESYSCHPDC